VTDRWVTLVDGPDHRRMTLTLPVLSASHVAVFLVTGKAKQAALARLLAGSDIPAARVRAERVVVLCDAAAAGA
jgi:6-phosphogluconolactonase/glucosamine-6-phosphate isomerase/deaminase